MVPQPVIVTAFPFGSANALETVGGFAVREDQNHLIVSGTTGQDIPCSFETGLNIGATVRTNIVNRVLNGPIRVGESALHLARLFIADHGNTVLPCRTGSKHDAGELPGGRFRVRKLSSIVHGIGSVNHKHHVGALRGRGGDGVLCCHSQRDIVCIGLTGNRRSRFLNSDKIVVTRHGAGGEIRLTRLVPRRSQYAGGQDGHYHDQCQYQCQ